VIEAFHDKGLRNAATVMIEMNRASVHDLAHVLDTAIGAGEVDIVVDLGERTEATSDLLTVLHRSARRLLRIGGQFAVVSAQPEVRRLFDLMLLSQAFGVFATRDEAVQSWQ
jgi:anti-anti-sigma factor